MVSHYWFSVPADINNNTHGSKPEIECQFKQNCNIISTGIALNLQLKKNFSIPLIEMLILKPAAEETVD
jgi:hypothetical protein